MFKVAHFILWEQEASDFLLCQGAKLLLDVPFGSTFHQNLMQCLFRKMSNLLQVPCSVSGTAAPSQAGSDQSEPHAVPHSRVYWCHNLCRCWSELPGALDSCLSWGLFRIILQSPSFRRLVLRIFQDFWSVLLDSRYCSTQRVFLVTSDFLSLSIRVFWYQSLWNIFFFLVSFDRINDLDNNKQHAFSIIIRS